ncbi:MAG: hypothetical protein QNJ00_11265 [Woeseiaceae bacterium]|nr:hypothetical protein [Woeseiaceae bacterium]
MNTRKYLLTLIAGLVVGLGAVGAVHADDDDDDDEGNAIVGTWRLAVSDGGPGFFDYMVFNADGTLTERASTGSFVSIGSGVWKPVGRNGKRRGRYAATFEAYNDGDFDTAYDSLFRVRLTLWVQGDNVTGTATVEVRTIDSAALIAGPFPGATFEGVRMKVLRE